MRFIFRLCAAALLAATFGGPALAQDRDQTLADIRQELSVLFVEVRKLNRELSTTGGASDLSLGGSVLDRVGAIESELQRLTAKTEELELRVDRIVRDGTNRIGDLEFRLVELEGGDLSQLGETSTLGGGEVSTVTPALAPEQTNAPQSEMAVGERADFEAAEAAMAAGNHAEAAALFAAFRSNYPGGPLSERAGLSQGAALEAAGDTAPAARAYLDVFSTNPQGAVAPEALFLLGQSLGRLGQTDEACLTLTEVGTRFPASDKVLEAQSAMQNLGCS
ncbi:tetratricopeptide repeat protein [Roseovarius sp. LXJ103]|uniref:tetratricopeptide repeat protein n=1 Tax=Roseovarius carneus TaxID=2853164 RepID=UPI000D62098A|nr:tetratricopeptide repeat protein [Roseovarius carneus]MBZ8118593.1 tetratricopeptide repeat protein [Roseovarius carneus]PWE35718.1 tol-pal system protein [Pelagicola sp. LXJ1103]